MRAIYRHEKATAFGKEITKNLIEVRWKDAMAIVELLRQIPIEEKHSVMVYIIFINAQIDAYTQTYTYFFVYKICNLHETLKL